MNDTAIISIVLGCMIGCVMLYAVGMLIFIDIELYFLHFKIEKHPMLIQMIEDVIKYLSETENIKIFHKTYVELNANKPEGKDNAVGRYIYTIDIEHQKVVNQLLIDVKEMEAKYRMPYDALCRIVGRECIGKERLYLPRIELADDELNKYGVCSYYDTCFHEFGHHFAHKELGDEVGETEEAADLYAGKLVKQFLPSYFLLFFHFAYHYKKNGVTLTNKEKFRAIINFLLYLRQKRNFDKTKNV